MAITTSQTAAAEAAPGLALLAWYDRAHRQLPWRIGPADRARGARPDPYHVWLSEVMLQQTTVAAATGHFHRFTARWPDVRALATAPEEAVLAAWAGLGYYARARNLHRCARVVAGAHGGRFPRTEAALRALPGIGAYTAAAIAAIAFDAPAVVLDGNIERVMARLHAETDPLPGVKARLGAHAAAWTPEDRPGDHAQALMDLGATVCTPRRPRCGVCPLAPVCRGRAEDIAERLPVKAPRRAKPIRRGIAYLARDPAGRVLVVRRPEKGLLAGMLALPTTDWTETEPAPAPPFEADWRPLGEVRHTFTHFHLRLTVLGTMTADIDGDARPMPSAEAAMPTVFAKALRLGRGTL